ncbi:MAG: protein kinase [Planctomycetes bacterium]|nr:protein kinase [Planctomycetota bacterium]
MRVPELPDFDFEGESGRGGSGSVHRATDRRLRCTVAVKFVRVGETGSAAEQRRRRILDESAAAVRLTHENVVRLFATTPLSDGRWALVTEWVEGGTLAHRWAEGSRAPADEVRRVAIDLLRALAFVHENRIVHGDVKPENVLVAADGRAKLADFGVASLREERGDGVPGTAAYLSPEAWRGSAPTPAWDLWAVGVLLHRALTGTLPFDDAELPRLFYTVLHDAPPPLPPDVPEDLASLVAGCLEKAPERRWSAHAALQVLERGRTPVVAVTAAAGATPEAEGREGELATVVAALGAGTEDEPGAAVVWGPAGLGKSALLREAARAFAARGGRWVSVSAERGVLPSLLAAVPHEDGPGRPPIAAAIERGLLALAAERPVAVAVDDTHEATPDEMRTLARIVRRAASPRIGWVLAERAPAGTKADALRAATVATLPTTRAVALGPLAPEAVYAILERRADPPSLAADVVAHVVQRAAGNPLLALQLFRHLRDTGLVALRDRRWQATEPLPSATTPPEIRELVASGVAGLDAEERAVLETAALDGLAVDVAVVAAATDATPLRVVRALERMAAESGLVAARDGRYELVHPLVRDAVADAVPDAVRTERHRRLALASEDAVGAAPERVGTHWERAGEPAQARPYLVRAARAAAARMENHRTVALAHRAGLLPPPQDDDVLLADADALLDVAFVCGNAGLLAERDDVHRQLREAAARKGRGEVEARVAVRRTLHRVVRETPTDADFATLRSALAVLAPCEDRTRALYALGLASKEAGRLDEAEAWLRETEQAASASGDLSHEASALDQRGGIATRRGHAEEAGRLHRRAAELCTRSGRTGNALVSEVNAVLADVRAGRLEDAAPALARLGRRLEIEGMALSSWSVVAARAEVLFALGRWAESGAEAERAARGLAAVGAAPRAANALLHAAEVALVTGDTARGHTLAREAADRAGGRSDADDRAIEAAVGFALAVSDAAATRDALDEAARRRALAPSAHVRSGVAWQLAEWMAIGGVAPADTSALAAESSPDVAGPGPAAELVLRAVATATAGRAQAPELLRVAASLEDGPVGLRREGVRLLARWLRCGAARAAGDARGAERERAAGAAEALRLAHAPWRAAFRPPEPAIG